MKILKFLLDNIKKLEDVVIGLFEEWERVGLEGLSYFFVFM